MANQLQIIPLRVKSVRTNNMKKKKENLNLIENSNVTKNSKIAGNKSGSKTPIITLLTITTILISILAFKVYNALIEIPDMPELDFNKDWGKSGETRDVSIRKFRPLFTSSMQEQLSKKFFLYNQAEKRSSLPSTQSNYGLNSEVFNKIFSYWQYQYSFRNRDKFINKFQHYKTKVQGLDIHYVHTKPNGINAKALPILILHSWPGTFRDFYDVLPVLTGPKSGYDFVFEVVVPSLPGFAYSEAPSKPGLSPTHLAIVLRNLMKRLGFNQFYVHGGDIGQIIGSHMATIFPEEVLGFHSISLTDLTFAANLKVLVGSVWPALVVDKKYENKMYPLIDKFKFYLEESGSLHLQATKPDTIGTVLNDSPAGLASYIADRILVLSSPSNKNKTDAGLQNYDVTHLLDTVSIFWSTGSITTSLRLFREMYQEADLESIVKRIPTKVPTWNLEPKHSVVHQPEWVLKWKYPNLLGTTYMSTGGHYLAFEKPTVLANNILFYGVKKMVEFHKEK